MATQDEARDALFEAIKDLADSSQAMGGTVQARMVAAAGYAYAAATGQPAPPQSGEIGAE